MKTLSSFAKEIIAIIKGDDAEATAQKIFRQADSAFKTQIASLKGDTIALEDAVTEAEENCKKALHNNGQLIVDRNAYIKGIIEAENKLTMAQDKLADHLELIELLEKKHQEIQD